MNDTTRNTSDDTMQPRRLHATRELSIVSGSLTCQPADNALGREFRAKTGEYVATTHR